MCKVSRKIYGGEVQNLYFCLPECDIAEGLKMIIDEMEYVEFIEIAYHCGTIVPMYVDHTGVNVQEWIVEDHEEVISPEDHHSGVGGDVSPQMVERFDRIDLNTPVNNPKTPPEMVDGLENDVGEHDREQVNIGDIDREADVQTRFNVDVDRKKQKHVLGMLFESLKQLKDMLCNYAVAN